MSSKCHGALQKDFANFVTILLVRLGRVQYSRIGATASTFMSRYFKNRPAVSILVVSLSSLIDGAKLNQSKFLTSI